MGLKWESKPKKKSTTTKKKKNRVQHTKLILNIIIALTVITTIASIYINLRNGFSLDSVVMSMVDALKWIIPSGCAKSFLETKSEKMMRLEYLKAGMQDKYDGSDI